MLKQLGLSKFGNNQTKYEEQEDKGYGIFE